MIRDIDTNDPRYKHPFEILLMELWPREWKEQLTKMNASTKSYNKTVEKY